MGFKDANWAYALDLPMTQKVVLVAVCHRTDDKTHATTVGQQTIATMTGASVDTVGRAMKALDQAGILDRTRRTKAFGQRTSDLIVVNRAYPSESGLGLTGTERTRDAAPYSAESGTLTRTLRHPNPHTAGGNRDQSVDQSVINVSSTSGSSDFEKFWEAWPRRVDKPKALTAWAEAIKSVGAETIITAARAYRNSRNLPEPKFIPYPATWLGRRGWEEVEIPRKRYDFGQSAHMQTVQPGSDCGPRNHRRQPDGTCRMCEQRDIPEEDAVAWQPRTIAKNDEWMYR